MIVKSQKIEAERVRVTTHVQGYLEDLHGEPKTVSIQDTGDPERFYTVQFLVMDLPALQKIVADLIAEKAVVAKIRDKASRRKK